MESSQSNSEVTSSSGSTDQTGNIEASKHQPHRLNIPGFITDEDIGLGGVIKRATYALGIKHCGGCQRRAGALNRWLVFSPRRSK